MNPLSYKNFQYPTPLRNTINATLFEKGEVKPEYSGKYRPFLEDYLHARPERFKRILEKALELRKISPEVANRPFFMNAFLLTLKVNEYRSKDDLDDMKKKFVEDFNEAKPSQEQIQEFYKSLFSHRSIPLIEKISLFLESKGATSYAQGDPDIVSKVSSIIKEIKPQRSLSEKSYNFFLNTLSSLGNVDKKSARSIKEACLDPEFLKPLSAEQEEEVFETMANLLCDADFTENEMVDFFCRFCQETATTDGSVFLQHSAFKFLSPHNERRVSEYKNDLFF